MPIPGTHVNHSQVVCFIAITIADELKWLAIFAIRVKVKYHLALAIRRGMNPFLTTIWAIDSSVGSPYAETST